MNTPQMPFGELIKSGQPVLVDFFADWCGPTGDRLKIVKIDIDRSRAAADKYQIRSVPTLILFKDGKIIWRQSGAQPLHKLEADVKPYL